MANPSTNALTSTYCKLYIWSFSHINNTEQHTHVFMAKPINSIIQLILIFVFQHFCHVWHSIFIRKYNRDIHSLGSSAVSPGPRQKNIHKYEQAIFNKSWNLIGSRREKCSHILSSSPLNLSISCGSSIHINHSLRFTWGPFRSVLLSIFFW